MLPEVGGTARMMVFTVVVLPQAAFADEPQNGTAGDDERDVVHRPDEVAAAPQKAAFHRKVFLEVADLQEGVGHGTGTGMLWQVAT